MSENQTLLPLSFRADLLKRVLADLRAGECCSLVGTSGTGKSNVARFLQRHEVQKAYWNDAPAWVIVIDSNSLIFDDQQKAEYTVTEIMIMRLIEEARSRAFSSEFLRLANKSYSRLLANPTFPSAMDTLQEMCRHLYEQHTLQLIFVFDQFDDLWLTLEARFFLNLRNLRDQFKYHVVYLVMTRKRLEYMRQDAQAVESFWELFSAHTYGLGPYNESDTTTMVERLAFRAGIPASEVPHEVVMMSGGHPSILRAIFWAFCVSSQKSLHTDELLKILSVFKECEKVWNDLSPAEQQLAQIIAQQLPLRHATSEALNDLRLKRIVSGNPPTLFSPLFVAYTLQEMQSNVSGVTVDPRLRQVWLDGRLLQEPLSPLEFGLLEYLARYTGTVCKRKDVLDALYPEEIYHSNTDQRLDALLSRLRKALGENAQKPRYLITHRGGGIQLLKGSISNDKD
jgi:DNA-binding winged helix-turn-helix (wHTH) protein